MTEPCDVTTGGGHMVRSSTRDSCTSQERGEPTGGCTNQNTDPYGKEAGQQGAAPIRIQIHTEIMELMEYQQIELVG